VERHAHLSIGCAGRLRIALRRADKITHWNYPAADTCFNVLDAVVRKIREGVIPYQSHSSESGLSLAGVPADFAFPGGLRLLLVET
jgi:hypothetical protein